MNPVRKLKRRIYVGNLPKETSEDCLRQIFSPYGQVGKIYFNTTQKGYRYAHVEMQSETAVLQAVGGKQGLVIGGRTIKVAPGHANVKQTELKRSLTWPSYGSSKKPGSLAQLDHRSSAANSSGSTLESSRKVGITEKFDPNGMKLSSHVSPQATKPQALDNRSRLTVMKLDGEPDIKVEPTTPESQIVNDSQVEMTKNAENVDHKGKEAENELVSTLLTTIQNLSRALQLMSVQHTETCDAETQTEKLSHEDSAEKLDNP